MYNHLYDYMLRYKELNETLKEVKLWVEQLDTEKEKFHSIVLRIKYHHKKDLADVSAAKLSKRHSLTPKENNKIVYELKKLKTSTSICRISERKLAQKESIVLLITK
jgi:hypothetical protein